MKHFILITYCFFASQFVAFAQQTERNMFTWEDFVTIVADESDDESLPDQELFEELYELHLHPMNLNTIKEEDLHKLPFLTEGEISDIIYYIEKHSPLFSTGELMFIYSLSKQKRQMIQLFCYAGEVKTKDYNLKNILKDSKNELTLRTDFPLYTKAGFSDIPDSILEINPNKKYQGNRLFHSLRYTLSSQEHFFLGFQMEKDPGENYIDHFAGYAMLKNIGCIRTAIIGNYRLSFGHGLVVNTGTSFGKAMKLNSMELIDRGITKHSSTSESGYFTGAATTLHFGKANISAFISYKNANATFTNDSAGISSLKTDGLHRTLLEKSKKGNIKITDFGANIHFNINNLQLSATAAFTHLNAPLTPSYKTPSTYYRQYYPSGYDFSAYSISYSYRQRKLLFSGESAIDSHGGFATLNQLQWTPNSYNILTLIQRQYGAKYNALNARAFGENSKTNNERGVYVGWNTQLTNKLNLESYIDAIYFPWLKYQVSSSSYCIDVQLQLNYAINNNHNISIRYKIKTKQKDYKEDYNPTQIKFRTQNNIRLQYYYLYSDNLTLKTTINGTLISFGNTISKGFSLGEAIRFTGLKNTRIDLSATYFNTDSFESRIYNYESSLLYTFSMNSYYCHGIRSTILVSWKPSNSFSITAKLGSTLYFDKEQIGSSLDLINNSHKEDIQIQLRWKF